MKIPKYLQIKNELEQEIKSGKFANGDKFYSEKELTEMYGVSSITVIRAIQELTAEGFLVRHQGKGTFISRSRKRKLVEFSDIEKFSQSNDVVTVVSMDLEQDEHILKELKLRKNAYYYKIVRIRQVDDEPYFIQHSYIPVDFIDLTHKTKDDYTSIYHRFKKDFNINANEENSIETNEICLPTPTFIAQALNMPESEPTVLQKKTTSLKEDDSTVIEHVVSYKKWDYYKIEISSFS